MHSIKQPMDAISPSMYAIIQSVWATNQSINEPIQATNQSLDQPINKSANQYINQSTNPIKQFKQSNNQSIN